jgi:hypothetical protein
MIGEAGFGGNEAMGGTEKRTGKHSVVCQHGGAGYYAMVEVEVESAVGFRLKIDADCRQWAPGVEFGIHYAWEALPLQVRHGGALIRVTTFRGMDVDTSTAVAALASAMALFNAYGIKLSHPPRLDPEKGEVVFPKHPL